MSEVEGTDGRLLADRYRLGAVLGKGGMGTVWRAVDETLGRSVAVKELRFPGDVDDDEKRRLVTRTLREAKATARIRNTGAITVFDVVKEDNRPWIVMELVEGRSLSDAIREDGPVTPKRAAEIGLVLLDVLKAAHHEGILHRDVKPSNVLLADDGRVVLGDFGIAQIDGDPSVTSTGMLVGAPSYISPERARGQKPGPPADLWSLGALLFASVEGHPPYDKGSAIATLTAVMTEPVGQMDNAGPLAEVIKGLLIKDPEQRLTEPAARAMLTTVAKAPERPVAPPAPAGDSRTMILPVDPQPTPTDAPPEAREAAADQAKVRDALRSVRKSAVAKPRPAPEPGTPANTPAPPARAPLTDVVPRRTLVIVVAVVVLAILGTVIGLVAANSGGGKGHDSKNGDTKPGAVASSGPTTTASAPDSGHAASPSQPAANSPSKPAASASSTPSDDQGADQGTGQGTGSGKGGGAGKGGGDALPPGYSFVTNDQLHFRIALPAGWHLTGSTTGGDGAIYSASGGYPRVQVDFASTPGKDAAAAWREEEPAVKSTSDDYQRISIDTIQYRGYRTAADWDFYRTEDGKKTRVQNRGFVVDDHHAYSIMVSIPATDWDSAASTTMRNTFFASFQSKD
ncbi:Serine/threonine protein kinase [Streptomyces sp. DvalAA-14]|uniref:serine/threonine-protein kinase n=1 Tax=unclassified Streptomyces TaxID=2593676 RepID=UPI00081B665C|nr:MULTISPECIES: serine/threonine-protein kinase [unclassified Streptomyces]MYS25028.1 protein kinase [Streptomyces sp. SID4948]SCE51500.1 Serine/threonine protein kinase [Streptomyces sp. DvalAA-14]